MQIVNRKMATPKREGRTDNSCPQGRLLEVGLGPVFYFPLLVNLFGVHFVSHNIAKESNASVRYGKYVN